MATDVIRAALAKIWSLLESSGNHCALMGGAALAAWNHPRATRDIDVLLDVDGDSFTTVMEDLIAAGCRPKHTPPLRKVGEHSYAQFLYTPPDEFYDVQLDIWLAESELQRSAIARRVPRSLPEIDLTLNILAVEDLILFKLVSGRLIDRADAAMLLRENRDAIDFQYLHGWVSRLDLSSDFGTIWKEAFPGEAK